MSKTNAKFLHFTSNTEHEVVDSKVIEALNLYPIVVAETTSETSTICMLCTRRNEDQEQIFKSLSGQGYATVKSMSRVSTRVNARVVGRILEELGYSHEGLQGYAQLKVGLIPTNKLVNPALIYDLLKSYNAIIHHAVTGNRKDSEFSYIYIGPEMKNKPIVHSLPGEFKAGLTQKLFNSEVGEIYAICTESTVTKLKEHFTTYGDICSYVTLPV